MTITTPSSKTELPPRDYRAEVTDRASTDVRDRLLQLSDQLAADMCRFSETCCPHFGLLTRDDCTYIADTVVLDLRPNFVPGVEIGVDEQWAARCLELVAELSTTCVFEDLTWWAACRNVLTYSDVPEPECEWPEDCVLLRGEGHVCWNNVCVPEFPASEGESCKWVEGVGGVPACGEDLVCVDGDTEGERVCEALGDVGEPCHIYLDCKDDLDCVDSPEPLAGGICVLPQQPGEPCEHDQRCAKGSSCHLDNTYARGVCMTIPNPEPLPYGAACTSGDRCPYRSPCVEGVCRYPGLASHFCGVPELAQVPVIPIEQVPSERKLTDLSDAESQALCTWAGKVFEGRVQCDGAPVGTVGCARPSSTSCTATVAQYQACLPVFADRLDGCTLPQQALDGSLFDILESTPGCAGLGDCVTSL